MDPNVKVSSVYFVNIVNRNHRQENYLFQYDCSDFSRSPYFAIASASNALSVLGTSLSGSSDVGKSLAIIIECSCSIEQNVLYTCLLNLRQTL